MKCPIDGQKLSHLLVNPKVTSDVSLDMCTVCQGVWLDHGELEKLISHFSVDEKRTYQDWLIADSDGTTLPKDFWHESERTCPKDQAVLQRHYSGAASGVGIDQCPTCKGFWFDNSELYAIAKANEPHPELDLALGSSAAHLASDLGKSYRQENVQWIDMYNDPRRALPLIRNSLLNLAAAYIASR